MKKKNILKMLVVLVFLIVPFLFTSLAFADKIDNRAEKIANRNKAIQAKGAKWVAGHTSVSDLSLAQKKKRANLKDKKPNETPVNAEDPGDYLLMPIPPKLDWRDNDDNENWALSYITPIKDQGNCGSCWAFATTAALETYTLIRNKTPNEDLDLSEQVMVSCSGCGSCGGGSITCASSFIRDTGLPLETCYPYTATNGSCGNACEDWEASAYKIDRWVSLTQSLDNIKQGLNVYGPLVVAFRVYDDFYDYESGIYSYVEGSYIGNHAVLIVGYDDDNECLIVKNSWGTGWGEDGFFRIAYSEVESVVDFGYSTIGDASSPENLLMGCYIAPSPPTILGPETTVAGCIDTAAAAGYLYAGIAYHYSYSPTYRCCVGSDVELPTQIDQSYCYLTCPGGEPTGMCGGVIGPYVFASLYRTRVPLYIQCNYATGEETVLSEGPVTIKDCIDMATTAGFVYAGLRLGGECRGFNELREDGPLEESACNEECDVDPGEMCGGGYELSIYATGVVLEE